jgi:hypothetical protein
MEWIDQLIKSFTEEFLFANGLLGIFFILVIGIALYYITGDNHPYSKKSKPILIRGKRDKALPIKGITQLEADYKIIEVTREPLESEEGSK